MNPELTQSALDVTPVADIPGVGVRMQNALHMAGIYYAGDLLGLKRTELVCIAQIGREGRQLLGDYLERLTGERGIFY